MNHKNKNVLIIEDMAAASKVLKTVFQSCKEFHFSVDTAKNAVEADALLQIREYDVITIDLNLGSGGREGLDILQRQMLFGSCPKAVKIVVTGYSSLSNCVQAMRWGAWDFLDKDGEFARKVVDSAVRRLAELEEATREERHIFDEWLSSNEQMLLEKYSGEYIAIKDDQVIAHGVSMIALGTDLFSKHYESNRKPFILQVRKGNT